jgi:uncharacterized protein (TIGR01777 family)
MSRPLHVVLAGGSGQVGSLLARRFHGQGHRVIVLARTVASVSPVSSFPWQVVHWDGTTFGDWTSYLEHADVVINLAGRSVNCRYTEANRKAIKDSRVQTTRLLGQAIGKAVHPPPLWMNASTATIYRHTLDRAMDEDTGELGGSEPDAPSAWRFSIDVATSWEEAFFSAVTPRTRKVALRSAVVMSPDRGGIFGELLRLVRLGLGGTAGSGRQFVSWIHEEDFLRSVEYLIDHQEIRGPVNLASPNPLPNQEFMQALRKAWGIPVGLPASEWMLKLGAVVLRTETELILKSRRVVPDRLLQSGFRFEFPDWPVAAEDLVSRWRVKNPAAKAAVVTVLERHS